MEKKKVLIIPAYRTDNRIKFQKEFLSDGAGFEVTVFLDNLAPIYEDLINNASPARSMNIFTAMLDADVVIIKEHLQMNTGSIQMVENFDFAKLLKEHFEKNNIAVPRMILPILKKMEDCPTWINDFDTYKIPEESHKVITLIQCDAPIVQHFVTVNLLKETTAYPKLRALLENGNVVKLNDPLKIGFNRNDYFLDGQEELRTSIPLFMHKGWILPTIEIIRNPFFEAHGDGKILIRITNVPKLRGMYFEKYSLDTMIIEKIHCLHTNDIPNNEAEINIELVQKLFAYAEIKFLSPALV